MKDDFNYRNYKSKRRFINNVFKVVPDDFYNNRMYNFKKRKISIDTWQDIKNYPLVQITGKLPVKSNMFNSIAQVQLDGVSSYVIKDFDTYAKSFFGVGWKNNQWASLNNCNSNLISWDDYSNDHEVKHIIDEIQKRYDIIHCKYITTWDCRKEIKEMKEQIIQSKRVIYVREESIQQKDKIIELFKQKNMKN